MFYRVKRADRMIGLKVGDILFEAPDYGSLASDDTRSTGIKHTLLSQSHTGIPGFTIPKADVELLNIPRYYKVKQKDGSVWGVPVMMIALDRAKHYASEFGGDIDRSLREDTIPQFEGEANEQGSYELQDWAVGNMNWDDFDGHQVKLESPKPLSKQDFQDAWMGEYAE